MTEHLFAGSIWWAGLIHSAASKLALRVEDDGTATPVPADDVPAGAPRRRFPGLLLPGLVDAHVHSALVDLATVRAGGIAAVWDLGSEPTAIAALAHRAATTPDDRVGTTGPRLPRIRYAGPFLIAPGGYPSDRAWAPKGSWQEIDSADSAVEAVGRAHAGGATLIKATAHAGGPLLPPKTLTALVDAAHAVGLPVVVHAEGPGTVASAYEAGADLLAHTPWSEPLDDRLIRDCAARMQWISTLDIHTGTPPLSTAIDNLRRFHSYGGTVRYGTDLGNGPLPPAINPGEIRHLQSAGLSPTDILAAMTGSAATTRDVTWVPGGLDLDPAAFADSLATARVLAQDVRPR